MHPCGALGFPWGRHTGCIWPVKPPSHCSGKNSEPKKLLPVVAFHAFPHPFLSADSSLGRFCHSVEVCVCGFKLLSYVTYEGEAKLPLIQFRILSKGFKSLQSLPPQIQPSSLLSVCSQDYSRDPQSRQLGAAIKVMPKGSQAHLGPHLYTDLSDVWLFSS